MSDKTASEPAQPLPEALASTAEQRAITGRAGIVAAGTLTSRVLGLGREQVLAAMFTRLESDAFYIAFTIPNLLRQILAEGAVQTGVLPVLAGVRETRGDEAARRFFQRVRGLSLLVLCVACVAGMLAAPLLVRLFASGFSEIPGQLERTTLLTRLFFPYIVFMGTAALGLAALNTYGRYVVTAFAPALLNVGFIVCALCLPAFFVLRGLDRSLALVAGVWLGGALQVVAQWPSLERIDMLRAPRLALGDPEIRLVIRRLGPVAFGMGVYYVDVMVARNFLSEAGIGATSYFNYAQRLCDLPQGIFIMALQAATLPSLSRLVAQGDLAEVQRTFAFGARLSLFVAVPASLLLAALAEPIVVLVFQRGHFDAEASRQTARALLAQGLGIWMVALVRQLQGVYYALGDTRTPVLVSLFDFGVFLVLCLILRGPLGHVGISWAVTGSSFAQLCLLWLLMQRRLEAMGSGEILRALGHTLLAAVPAALAGAALAEVLTPFGTNAWTRLVPGSAGGCVFAAVFVGIAWLTKSRELLAIRDSLRRRRRPAR
jgi:putative peptidoglycan lipid II flippase